MNGLLLPKTNAMTHYCKQMKWLFQFAFFALSLSAGAQETTQVKGSVVSEQGELLSDVTIVVHHAGSKEKQSALSNEKGLFVVTGLKAGDKYNFLFTHVGYEEGRLMNYLVKAGDNNSVLIRLKQAVSSMNDVMVIGYGQQSRSKVTGAVSQVKSTELNRYNAGSFGLQLAGKSAGVVINDASAQPGSNPQVVIRGIGTLTAGRNPLVVVDGFPLSEGSSFNAINPQDIETIDILKDPASAAIYGSRAANGVILITTKKGKAEKMRVAVDVYTGVQQRADKVEYVNAYDAALFLTEARDWGYVSKDPANRSAADDRATRVAKGASLRELRLNYLQPYLDKQPGLTDTYWPDEVFRKAGMKSYNVSLSGGSAKTNYYVSANYFDQEGIVIENRLRRFSGTVKMDSKISDRFDFGVSINPSYNIQNYFNNNADWSNDPIANLDITYPFFAPYNSDGTLAISKQIIANTPEDGALGENPVALMKKIKNGRNYFKTFGNSYLSFKIANGLKLKTMAGADIATSYLDFFNPSDVGQYRGAAPKPAVADEIKEFTINYITENTLNYTNSFGAHDIDVLAGYTFQKEAFNSTDVIGSGVADNNLPNIAGASAFTATVNRYTWTQLSYLARLQYAYQNKYLFSATIRRDGSSRFGDDKKWGNFPSVTAGWIISKESFFPKSAVVSFAKLRATWGQSGNNQIGSYSSKALVSSTGTTNSNYVFGSTLASGFSANSTANANLSWETKTSSNIGLNVGLWNRFNISADYYNSITKDLLLNVPVPDQSGFSSSIQNIGKVKNTGVEVEVSGHDINLGPVKMGFSGNIATNQNKVLALAPGQDQIISGNDGQFFTKVGGPVAAMYGYKITGVYKTQDEINKTPHLTGTLPGDYIVEDVTTDGNVDLNDRISYGTFNPKFTWGASANFLYKQFELSFQVMGIEGRKIYDRGIASQREVGEGFGIPGKYYFENRYHPVDNPNGFMAQPNLGNFSNARKATRVSNYVYQDGDYIRLRNVQLSYNLPQQITTRLRATDIRIYFTGNNLFTITKFRGYNPEATTTDNVLTNGYSYANYPVARSYTFGVNLAF